MNLKRAAIMAIGIGLLGCSITYFIGAGFESLIYWTVSLPLVMVIGFVIGRISAPWVYDQ